MRALARVAGGATEAGAVITRRRRLQWVQVVLAWLAIVIAAARPLWLGEPIIRELPMRDLLVALDLSGSMETRDFTDARGEIAERLTAAKQVLDPFLARRDGDRVGLVFFGSAAFVQAVDELPDRYQTVFELCVRQGKAYQEAADELSLPTGTAVGERQIAHICQLLHYVVAHGQEITAALLERQG